MPLTEKILLEIDAAGREYYLCPPSKVHPPDDKHPEPWQEHPKPWVGWRLPDIREGFRARPGYKIVGADYSQAEVKLMAELAGDKWLTQALNSGKDIHCYTATDVYGKHQSPPVTYEEIYSAYKNEDDPNHIQFTKWRSNVKTTTFGVPYGAGAKRISAMTGLPEEDAQSLRDEFFRNAKELAIWLEKQGDQAMRLGWTKSVRGRRRFYHRPNMRAEMDMRQSYEYREAAKKKRIGQEKQIRRWAGNQPIQTSCVDLLKPAMVKIYKALRGGDITAKPIYDARIILSVHDEIVLEVRADQAEEVAGIVKFCMQESYDEVIKTIKNKVDVSIADYWKK